jgi:HAD superfamily phosphatase
MKVASPEIIIFDVDGVLVDVRQSFHRTLIQTVGYFTGRRVTGADIHEWKNRGGYNDDWKLSHAWIQSLGGKNSYEEIKKKFQEFYWGENQAGNVNREKWLLPKPALRRLAKKYELALFTGRTRRELDYTLDRCGVREFFGEIVTVESVKNPKPDPEGLQILLRGRDPGVALYLGDNIDDARSSKAARVPFLGILPYRSEARRLRSGSLESLGALRVLGDVKQLERWLETAVRNPQKVRAKRVPQTSLHR